MFQRPGECDLTVNVDFAYLKEAVADLGMSIRSLPRTASSDHLLYIYVPCGANGIVSDLTQYAAVLPHGPLPQATFLQRMGLETRVEALKKSAQNDERKREIGAAAQRLIDLTGMGSQYQVMGLSGNQGNELSIQEKWPFAES